MSVNPFSSILPAQGTSDLDEFSGESEPGALEETESTYTVDVSNLEYEDDSEDEYEDDDSDYEDESEEELDEVEYIEGNSESEIEYEDDDEFDDHITDGLTGGAETLRESGVNNSLGTVMGIDESSYTITRERIKIHQIVMSTPKKQSRRASYKGLTTVVGELGVINPIHVMLTESYKDAINSGMADRFTGARYLLIDGFRRVYAATRNRIDEIEAIVWDFEDPEQGADVALILGLLIHRTQKRTWEETWGLYETLEMLSAMSPAVIESLLGLESGEAMKLKDIALDNIHTEPWEELCLKKKDINGAYNMLQKLRREEDRLAIDDAQGIAEYGDAGELASGSGEGTLSEDDVREILELSDTSSDDLNFGEFDEDMLGEAEGDLQTTDERKPLDPILRGLILERDDYTCQICGLGKGIRSTAAIGTFEIHHTVSVMAGLEGSRDDTGMIAEGSDIPKLLTLCGTCHKLTHLATVHGGKLGISKEEFEELPSWEQDRWKKVAKYSKVLLWAEKKSGKVMKRSEMYKLPNKPFWEVEKENIEAMKLSDGVETTDRDY